METGWSVLEKRRKEKKKKKEQKGREDGRRNLWAEREREKGRKGEKKESEKKNGRKSEGEGDKPNLFHSFRVSFHSSLIMLHFKT